MEIRARNMDINRIQESFSTRVGDGSAFWKSTFRAGMVAAWEVMAMLCIMRRPQGLEGW
jgi:hypothetical protein